MLFIFGGICLLLILFRCLVIHVHLIILVAGTYGLNGYIASFLADFALAPICTVIWISSLMIWPLDISPMIIFSLLKSETLFLIRSKIFVHPRTYFLIWSLINSFLNKLLISFQYSSHQVFIWIVYLLNLRHFLDFKEWLTLL